MLRFIGYIRFLQWYYYYQDVMENEQILINIKVMTQFAADAVYKAKHSPRFTFAHFALDDNGRILRLSENKTVFKLLC